MDEAPVLPAAAAAHRRFGRAHLWLALAPGLVAAFGIALMAQEWDALWFMATGPLAGGLARGAGQWDCCGAVSMSLLPWGLTALALGVASQWLLPSQALVARWLRLALWFAGWVGWFTCGVLSCLHAFS